MGVVSIEYVRTYVLEYHVYHGTCTYTVYVRTYNVMSQLSDCTRVRTGLSIFVFLSVFVFLWFFVERAEQRRKATPIACTLENGLLVVVVLGMAILPWR